MKKEKRKLLIGGFLVALGFIYLIYAATQGSTVYYLTVEEFLEQQETLDGEGIRIAGAVAEGSIQRRKDSFEVTFAIQGASENAILPVRYTGTLPDLFQNGAKLVLEGNYNREQHIFRAASLMTSCPSKYESKLEKPKE